MTKTASRIIIIVLILCAAYAILRYNIFKGVEWSHFPLFIMNKILAFSGFVLLVLSLALEPLYRKQGPQWFVTRKFMGRTGMVLIIIHVIVSFLLFRPEIYGKFFGADGTLNAVGEWSMLFGALGITAYILMHTSFSEMDQENGFQNFVRSPFFGISALLISCLHIVIMGVEGWLTPREWHGGMPSITMVSTFVFLVGMLMYFSGQRKKQ